MFEAKLARECIDCGLCTEKCTFLKKYDMNLKEYESEREELAYNCFLCGECRRVCPAGIDGRSISVEARKRLVDKGRFEKKEYLPVILEKKDYLFKNYSHGRKKTVLFPGCNFPSFFPGTTKKLINMLGRAADIGTVFDCCGKPVYELGLAPDTEKIIGGIECRLAGLGVEELVTLCPNCFYFLKDRLSVKVTDIYRKLKELGLGSPLEIKGMNVFIPCPDREEKLIWGSIGHFLAGTEINELAGIQCCGLGGHGGRKEPGLARDFVDSLRSRQPDNIYTYCATCCGSFDRSGITGTGHILCGILKSEEVPAKGLNSLVNRAGFKFLAMYD